MQMISSIISAMTNSSPSFVFLFFSRRATSTTNLLSRFLPTWLMNQPKKKQKNYASFDYIKSKLQGAAGHLLLGY